jgi:hypothetical protein
MFIIVVGICGIVVGIFIIVVGICGIVVGIGSV